MAEHSAPSGEHQSGPTDAAHRRNLLLAVVTVLGVALLIWMETGRTHLPQGSAAPTFTLQLLDEQRTLSSVTLQGKPAVLDFWATWCGPCRASLPGLDQLAQRYQGKAQFVAVNADSEDPAEQRRFRDQVGLKMPIAFDGHDASNHFKVEVLPTTVVLDAQGRVVDTFTGGNNDAAIAHALDKLQ